MAIVFSIIASVISIVAVVLAIKAGKSKTEVVKETRVVYAPIEHPLVYDEKNKAYRLNGSLKVDGFVSCEEIEKGKE